MELKGNVVLEKKASGIHVLLLLFLLSSTLGKSN